jgi:hypothetical protein
MGSGVPVDGETGSMVLCGGDDVLKELNDVFGDPTCARYQYAQSHNTFGAIENLPGNCEALIKAYECAKVPVGGPWAEYLRRLGKIGSPEQGAQNIYDIAQIRYNGLTDGVIMLTDVHVPINGGHVRTVRGSKAGLHSSIDSPCPLSVAKP